jgi:wyosine [tRNA(Phe)-imidazoG37] synthetase (radical SAM superfamily)
MPTLEPKLLKEKIMEMPQQLRDAYFSENTTNKIMLVAKNHDLHIDQTGELSDEVGLVFLGVTPVSDFVKNIRERLKINNELAEKIVAELNTEIFEPARTLMKQGNANKLDTKAPHLDKPSIFERKLSEPVNLKPEATATAPTTPAPEEPIKKIDPYHEPIE